MEMTVHFKETFDRCYETLCAYAARILRDRVEAEDVVQESFVKWWEVIQGNREACSRAYLYRTVRNACIDRMRQPKEEMVSVHAVDGEAEELFQVESEEDGRAECLMEAINSLPEKARMVFHAICVNERKYQEVADEMNVSINTVKTQLARSIRLLRERVGTRET
jgi:RNA polymerase sigma-70 factor (ECF subfamily)